MFTLGGLRVRRRRAGALARRARAARGRARAGAARARLARPPQPAPLRRLPRARRDRRAVRRRGRVLELQGRPRRLAEPGRDARRSAATSSPTSSRSPSCTRRPTAGWSGSRSAPSCASARTAAPQAAAHVEGLLPVPGRRRSGPSRASSTASRRPRSASTRACTTTSGPPSRPDIAKLRPRIDEGDRLFDKAADDLTAEQSNEFLALALRGLTDSYAQSPPPARFRLEVNPMVTWIWIGGLIVAARRLHRRLAGQARA